MYILTEIDLWLHHEREGLLLDLKWYSKDGISKIILFIKIPKSSELTRASKFCVPIPI